MTMSRPGSAQYPPRGRIGEAQRLSSAAQQAPFHFWALVLLVALFVLRLIFLIWLSPWNLTEDEAHYWLWSKHLDWSYYSKGPGVAYIIAAGTLLLGDTEAGVRLLAPLFSLLTGLCVYLLMYRITLSGKLAILALVALQLAPILSALGLLLTIDGPYVAFWAGACLFAYLALEERRSWAYPALGLSLGAAFLVKYTALFLLAGIFVYIFFRGRQRQSWRGGSFWLFPLCLLFATSPVFIWNAQHDWVTFRHLLGHAHMGVYDHALHWQPWWSLEFLAAQLGAVGITLFPLILIAFVWSARRPLSDERLRAGRLLLLCCGAPILLFYTFASLVIPVQGNWAVAGYVTLLPLAAWLVADRVGYLGPTSASLRKVKRYRTAWHWAIGYGLGGLLILFRPDMINAPIALGNALGLSVPYLFPHKRLIGAEHLAAKVESLGERLCDEPLYIAGHYGRASLASFYLPSRAQVFAANSRMLGRQAQQDYWPHYSLDRPELRGRNAVLIAEPTRRWQREEAFDEIIICAPAKVERHGQMVKQWEMHLGVGYRGFPQRPARRY